MLEEIEVKEQRVDENLAESNRGRREKKGLMRLREEEEEEDRSISIMASIGNEEKRRLHNWINSVLCTETCLFETLHLFLPSATLVLFRY